MNVSFTKPQDQLAPYVASFWVFESSAGILITDSRNIVLDPKGMEAGAKYLLSLGYR